MKVYRVRSPKFIPSKPPSGPNIYSHIGSGGIVFAGDSTVSSVSNFQANGGVLLYGDAASSWIHLFQPSGGLAFGGDALLVNIASFQPSGGIVFGDGAQSSSIRNFYASGGITLAGSGGVSSIWFVSPSGGLLVSGFGDVFVIHSFSASGGVILNGSSTAVYINTSAGTKVSLTYFYDLTIRLDAKEIMDSGEIVANAGDTGGTTVMFNKQFKDIRSIVVSVKKPTTSRIVTYDFTDVPNPTSFKVFVWDTAGNRVTETVTWVARGVG